jgi:hypothetical protein
MDSSVNKPKPSSIHVEWRENGDFVFSCHYRRAGERDTLRATRQPNERYLFPAIAQAMGNVLRKLRQEHISFPLFLVSLAFNHRNLLSEIDRLLQALHEHVEQQEEGGEYTCLITSGNDHA